MPIGGEESDQPTGHWAGAAAAFHTHNAHSNLRSVDVRRRPAIGGFRCPQEEEDRPISSRRLRGGRCCLFDRRAPTTRIATAPAVASNRCTRVMCSIGSYRPDGARRFMPRGAVRSHRCEAYPRVNADSSQGTHPPTHTHTLGSNHMCRPMMMSAPHRRCAFETQEPAGFAVGNGCGRYQREHGCWRGCPWRRRVLPLGPVRGRGVPF